MKIGILTFHAAKNYGAFLQAYALKNVLIESTGNKVEIINYDMVKADDFYRRPVNVTKTNESESSKYVQKRFDMFEDAEKCFLSDAPRVISDNSEDFERLVTKKYDLIIVGSDEIWKIDELRGFPNPYWLPGTYGCKKYSYAASSRTDFSSLSNEVIEQIKNYLSDFEYIGVRDKVTKKFVERISGKEAFLNCDPTFAYDFNINKELGRWIIRNKFRVSSDKKCIALMLDNYQFFKEIVELYGGKFDFIPIHTYRYGASNSILSPFEFVQVIAGADGLICNHFHGTVFALKGNTPFLSFEQRKIQDKQFSKIFDLLSKYGLEDHFHMLEDIEEQSLREVGAFLADVYSGKAASDFSHVCEMEKELFVSFLAHMPINHSQHIIKSEYNCCGCLACIEACPVNAIKAVTDEKGFSYPKVDENICIGCGRCKEVCSFSRPRTPEPFAVYGVKHIDENVRLHSRSGGVFTALSDEILKKNGTVYGSALTEDFLACHKRAETQAERDAFCGSKYIQSNMAGIYKSIKDDLDSGKFVLFSGTPCQVSAVKKYIGDQERLFLLDIVCHGVPSPMVWRDYLDYQEKRHNGKVTHVDFRDKRFGWKDHRESFVINNICYDDKIFKKLYFSHLILRPSCFECPFKCVSRVGDITIADFWGVEKVIPDYDDDKGVSLLLINSNKGEKLFKSSKEQLSAKEVKLEDALQNSLRFPYPRPLGYDDFWRRYKLNGIDGYIKEEERDEEVKRKLQNELKKKENKERVKEMIKSILGKIWRVVFGN